MISTPSTIAFAVEYPVEAWASRNDGTSAGEQLSLSIRVEFRPETDGNATAPTQVIEELSDWLDMYVRGRDLTGTFDMSPTVTNLAVYVGRVAAQYAGDRLATVTITRYGSSAVVSATWRYGDSLQ